MTITIISYTKYDKGETLKIVIGAANIKIFIDQKKEKEIKKILGDYELLEEDVNVCEIRTTFPRSVIHGGGILATVTAELFKNEISPIEIITAKPELLLYVEEPLILRAYEVLKRIKKQANVTKPLK